MTQLPKKQKPLDALVARAQDLSYAPGEDDLNDIVAHDIIPVLQECARAFKSTMEWQDRGFVQLERVVRLNQHDLTEIRSDLTSLHQMVIANQGYEDYETRLTVEDAKILSEFVLASMNIIAESLPEGEQQQALLVRGKEILSLVDENTMRTEDEDENEDEGPANDG